jgi:hypothetical protein
VIGNIKLWVILALVFVVMMWVGTGGKMGDGSPLWFLDPLRTLTFLVGLVINERFHLRERLKLSRGQAIVLFLLLSWISGMAFELTLVDEQDPGGGILLLQGQYFITIQAGYLPLTVLGFLLIRKFHYTLREVFFAGALTCLWEVVTQGIPMMRAGNPITIPILIAYYMIAYSLILTWPLIFIDEKLLWDTGSPRMPSWAKILLGIPLGILNMLLYGGWGVVVEKMWPSS